MTRRVVQRVGLLAAVQVASTSWIECTSHAPSAVVRVARCSLPCSHAAGATLAVADPAHAPLETSVPKVIAHGVARVKEGLQERFDVDDADIEGTIAAYRKAIHMCVFRRGCKISQYTTPAHTTLRLTVSGSMVTCWSPGTTWSCVRPAQSCSLCGHARCCPRG